MKKELYSLMEVTIMKRLSIILITAMFTAPLTATYDAANKPNTQRTQPTLKEKACMAAAFVALSAGVTYLALEYDWFRIEAHRVYRNAYETALTKVQELVSNGTLTVPDNIMPEEFYNSVIRVAVSATNSLTKHLSAETIATLQKIPSVPEDGIILVPVFFVYLGTIGCLWDLANDGLQACCQYFSPKQTKDTK